MKVYLTHTHQNTHDRGRLPENELHKNQKEMFGKFAQEVYSYEKLTHWLKSQADVPKHNLFFDGKYVVFDEAHELVNIFKDITILQPVRQWFFHQIRHAKQFLLMTGTPMYNNVMDITYLVNLCPYYPREVNNMIPREPLLPFAERTFHQEYYKKSPSKSIIFGWLAPILNTTAVRSLICLAPMVGVSLLLKKLIGQFSLDNVVFGARKGQDVVMQTTGEHIKINHPKELQVDSSTQGMYGRRGTPSAVPLSGLSVAAPAGAAVAVPVGTAAIIPAGTKIDAPLKSGAQEDITVIDPLTNTPTTVPTSQANDPTITLQEDAVASIPEGTNIPIPEGTSVPIASENTEVVLPDNVVMRVGDDYTLLDYDSPINVVAFEVPDSAFDSNFLESGIGADILKTMSSLIGLSSFSLVSVWGLMGPWLFSLILLSVIFIMSKYNLDNIYSLNLKKIGERIGGCLSFHSIQPIKLSSFTGTYRRTRQLGALTKKHIYTNASRFKSRFYVGHTERNIVLNFFGKEITLQKIKLNQTIRQLKIKLREHLQINNIPATELLLHIGDTILEDHFLVRHIDFIQAKMTQRAKDTTIYIIHNTNKNFKISFKTVQKQEVNICYNGRQEKVFLELTTGLIADKNTRVFSDSENKNISEFDIFGTNYAKDQYLKHGRKIGNLIINKDGDVVCPCKKTETNKTKDSFPGLEQLFTIPQKQQNRSVLINQTRRSKTTTTSTAKQTGGGFMGSSETIRVDKHGNMYPSKFVQLLAYVVRDINKNTTSKNPSVYHVVYSEFDTYGVQSFKAFIEHVNELVEKNKKVNKKVYVPLSYRPSYLRHVLSKKLKPLKDKFVLGRTIDIKVFRECADQHEPPEYDILLLHKEYHAGISLHKGTAMHLLEPISNPSRVEQIVARVNRFKYDGYGKDIILPVYTYISDTRHFITHLFSKIKKFATNLKAFVRKIFLLISRASETIKKIRDDPKKYFKNFKNIFHFNGAIHWKRFKYFDQNISPDYIVQKQMKDLDRTISALRSKLPSVAKLNHSKLFFDNRTNKMRVGEHIAKRVACEECQNYIKRKYHNNRNQLAILPATRKHHKPSNTIK